MISGVNFLSLIWLLFAIVILCTHLLLILKEDVSLIVIPIRNLFLFGKVLHRHHPSTKKTEPNLSCDTNFLQDLINVPKSWFKHFYVTGLICHSLAFIILLSCLYDGGACDIIKQLQRLLVCCSAVLVNYKFNDSALPLVLVFLMEWCQIARRAYECYCISSFSKSTMNLLHYCLGIMFYALFGIGLLVSIPMEKLAFSTPNFMEVLRYIIALGIFAWAFQHQHKSMLTLASLRQEQKDKHPAGHFIPHGHLFDLVSSPHFLCEIIMYGSFSFVFRFQNMYLNSLAIFVLINQVCTASFTHRWYKEHFPNYPAHRKVLIPYLW